MPTTKFIPKSLQQSVRELDLAKAQVEVIEASGVSVVFGAAGSGKTTTLIAKFLKLIEQGLLPEQIVVLTQTRESANLLRDVLALELQGATRGPLAKTITSLAFAILSDQSRKQAKKAPTLFSGSEQDALLRRLIEQKGSGIWPKQIDQLTTSLQGFRTELRDLLQVCLEWGITPDQLKALSKQHSKESWQAASEIFESYLLELSSENKLDAAMLLRSAAAKVLENPKDYSPEKISAILVDDAQELTPAAAELIFRLSSQGAEVCLFGDPDVATLGFRAANPKAMTDLAEKIATERKSSLQPIYLSPNHAIRRPELSSALSKVITQIEVSRAGRQRRGINPPAALVGGDGISAKLFANESDEITFLAGELRRRHLFGEVPWSKMAVIARSRPALETLAIRLSAESVPVRLQGALTTLRDEHASRQLLRLCQFVLTEAQLDLAEITELLVSDATSLDAIGFQRLRRSLRIHLEEAEKSDQEILTEVLLDPTPLKALSFPAAKKVTAFIELLNKLKSENAAEPLAIEMLLWRLYSESGLKNRWLQQSRGLSEIALQANKNLDSVLTLFAAANRFSERNPGVSALDFVDDQLSRSVPEDSLALNDFQGDYVSLLTPSALIGKRFDTVALPGLIEGVWPNLRPRSSLLGAKTLDLLLQGEISSAEQETRSELTDELRMLAKSIGSATEKVLMSATDSEDEQVSQFFVLVTGSIPEVEQQLRPNPTLRSLTGTLRRQLLSGPKQSVAEVSLALARLASAGIPGADPASWYGNKVLSTEEELVDLGADKVTLRPSQLENYLKCPLHWFLDSHSGGDSSFSASLGTLIHEVLELSQDANPENLNRLVESRWHTLEFESDWLADSGKRQAGKMVSNLAEYLAKFEKEGGQVIAREENFSFELETLRVRGQVDRIEKLPDGSCVIVDLKTGKSTLSAAELQEHAQLNLYQLAFLEGGFSHLSEVEGSSLAGAKLLVIGGDSASEKKQEKLDIEKSGRFKKLLLEASEGMSKPVFVARISSHCSSDREYGSCKLHLTKAVSYVG